MACRNHCVNSIHSPVAPPALDQLRVPEAVSLAVAVDTKPLPMLPELVGCAGGFDEIFHDWAL